ncbi:MAG: zinc ribbon domain-containing protein [Promethearchaeota archaeon]
MFNLGDQGETKKCADCGYTMSVPLPLECPRCGSLLEKTGYALEGGGLKEREKNKNKRGKKEKQPKKFIPVVPEQDFSYRFEKNIQRERRKQKKEAQMEGINEEARLEKDPNAIETTNLIFLSEDGDYLKMMGAINTDNRKVLYCSSKNYEYILELGANSLEIASSILGGDLEKILFEPPSHLSAAISHSGGSRTSQYEEAYFLSSGPLLFCIYGVFFKRPDMLLKELKRMLLDILKGKEPATITKMERYEITRRESSITNYILKEYIKFTSNVLQKDTIPTMEDQATIHYVGLSYQSIGTMSLLITPEGEDALPMKDIPFKGDTPDGVYYDLLESLISAKIEAIAANTLANTGSFPKYIITKIGFDHYRMLEFLQLGNDYNLQVLASGNARVLDTALKSMVLELVRKVTKKPFTGMLETFNNLKEQLFKILHEKYIFKLEE